MKHSIILILCVALYAMQPVFAQHSPVNYGDHAKDLITVTGYGEVSAEPDMAILSVSVSAINVNINTAKAEADAKYSKVLAAAKRQGVDKKDIKLSTINLNPEYKWTNNSQKLVGTRVSRSLTITVKQISRVAPLLQELVEGDVSRIDQVQTGFQDRADLEREALAAAIEDAKEKANYLAAQFDKELGSAHRIAERNQTQPVRRQFAGEMAKSMSMSADLPEEHFGTQKVRSQVNVVFHAQ